MRAKKKARQALSYDGKTRVQLHGLQAPVPPRNRRGFHVLGIAFADRQTVPGDSQFYLSTRESVRTRISESTLAQVSLKKFWPKRAVSGGGAGHQLAAAWALKQQFSNVECMKNEALGLLLISDALILSLSWSPIPGY